MTNRFWMQISVFWCLDWFDPILIFWTLMKNHWYLILKMIPMLHHAAQALLALIPAFTINFGSLDLHCHPYNCHRFHTQIRMMRPSITFESSWKSLWQISFLHITLLFLVEKLCVLMIGVKCVHIFCSNHTVIFIWYTSIKNR